MFLVFFTPFPGTRLLPPPSILLPPLSTWTLRGWLCLGKPWTLSGFDVLPSPSIHKSLHLFF